MGGLGAQRPEKGSSGQNQKQAKPSLSGEVLDLSTKDYTACPIIAEAKSRNFLHKNEGLQSEIAKIRGK
jgi:hypothetical protein